jgi:hypothetical protein
MLKNFCFSQDSFLKRLNNFYDVIGVIDKSTFFYVNNKYQMIWNQKGINIDSIYLSSDFVFENSAIDYMDSTLYIWGKSLFDDSTNIYSYSYRNNTFALKTITKHTVLIDEILTDNGVVIVIDMNDKFWMFENKLALNPVEMPILGSQIRISFMLNNHKILSFLNNGTSVLIDIEKNQSVSISNLTGLKYLFTKKNIPNQTLIKAGMQDFFRFKKEIQDIHYMRRISKNEAVIISNKGVVHICNIKLKNGIIILENHRQIKFEL